MYTFWFTIFYCAKSITTMNNFFLKSKVPPKIITSIINFLFYLRKKYTLFSSLNFTKTYPVLRFKNYTCKEHSLMLLIQKSFVKTEMFNQRNLNSNLCKSISQKIQEYFCSLILPQYIQSFKLTQSREKYTMVTYGSEPRLDY